MNTVLKIVLSLSLSGSLLIVVLCLGRSLLKDRLSKRWQYYIWLAAIARLLLPFTPEVSLVGTLFQQMEDVTQMEVHLAPGEQAEPAGISGMGGAPLRENVPPAPASRPAGDMLSAVPQYLCLAWLGAALLLLIRKITVYQGFVKYIRAGRAEVSDIDLLDRFAQIEEEMGIKRPVELYVNQLIFSPLLLGFFRPCVVLPDGGMSAEDFIYTARHELTHYKRRDMLYKWLVQLTVCLHWFNPLVWLMEREISRACELACDEAVIRRLGPEERRAYGDTLLRAMGAGGSYQNSLASVTLHESAELLKERLSAIMKFKRSSRLTVMLSFALAGALTMGAAAAGAYPGPVKSGAAKSGAAPVVQAGTQAAKNEAGSSMSRRAERYYEANSYPLFQIVFSRLDEEEQLAWLERFCADDDVIFFSTVVRMLDKDSPLIDAFAEKTYMEGEIAFFSILTDCMDENALEAWLDRALEDGSWSFQSMLFNKLDKDEEKEALERELEAKQLEEYRKVGVTSDGKNYYYKGQLVDIFLDQRPNSSFYKLDMNPAGTVNVKIIRDQSGKITEAAYMTEEEREELFGNDEDEEIDIPVDIARVKSGEYVWLGTYTLDEGDEVYYEIWAETGEQMDVGFASPGQKTPNPRYHQVSCRRNGGELEVVSGPMVWEQPLKPGQYSLFVHTEGGALTNVEGCVMIVRAGADASD